MNRLIVASVTFRHLPTEQREAAAGPIEKAARQFTERIVLHTCHRVELIALADAGNPRPYLPPEAQRTFGLDAAERVLLVTGGLDSAVLAEEQILGQVREAYQAALGQRETGPTLNELLRRAIRFGKRVRSAAMPGTDRSIADRAVRWVLEQSTLSPPRLRALVIGTGAMGHLAALRLAEAGARLTVASQSIERATQLVGGLPNTSFHSASVLADSLVTAPNFDVIVIAARASSTQLEVGHVAIGRLPLVVDFSAPGAIAPPLAVRLGNRLLNLDRIEGAGAANSLPRGLEARFRAEARAEAARFGAWAELRSTGDGVAALRSHAEEIRQRHLNQLRQRARLDPDQLDAVQAMTSAMFGELLHAPTLVIRRDPEAAVRVRRLFGIEQ
jgi:glutamyl-tRNA reductase